MALKQLSPLEIAIHRMEQQLTAMQMEVKTLKAIAAQDDTPQPKRELFYRHGNKRITAPPQHGEKNDTRK